MGDRDRPAIPHQEGGTMTATPDWLTVEALARLLREAEQAHGAYENLLGRRDDDWSLWYARHMLGPLRELLAGGQAKSEPTPEA
jgi:hypothetical protein